nr:GDSL esterase/lipase 1-like [Ipomoea trifida]
MASFCVHVFALSFLASFCNSVHSSALNKHHVALFVFGDSIFDAGNNNYINTTNDFKANFRPYGETSFPNATGRFSDGRLIPDFIANFAKKSSVKPYLAIKKLNGGFINGVNFASAGAGSLDGTNAGLVISLKAQLGYFKKVSQQLKKEVGNEGSKKLLSNAVYMFNIGSNDYSNYVLNSTLLNAYTQNQYVDMVVGNMSTVFQEIYKEGGRKFVIVSVGAIGCVPAARAANFRQTVRSECVEILQTLAKLHNQALLKLLNNLATNLPGFKYSYFDYFQSSIDAISNPSTYGFTEVKAACCGSGPFRGDPSCGGKRGMPFYELCPDVQNFLYFDFVHPTEKSNHLSAISMWDTSPYVTPNNVKSFFLPY